MKKNWVAIPALAATLIFLNGCAQKPPVNNISIDNTKENLGENNDAQYKFLYNPPAGGNPENVGKILFASDPANTSNTDYNLFSVDPDGSNKTQLTHFGKYINDPVWSPERSRIAYSAHVDEANTDKIFIMTADGSETRQLTFGEGRDKFPTWSPDGKQIAYISYRDNIPNLFVVDTHGQNAKQLTFVDGKNTVGQYPKFVCRGYSRSKRKTTHFR